MKGERIYGTYCIQGVHKNKIVIYDPVETDAEWYIKSGILNYGHEHRVKYNNWTSSFTAAVTTLRFKLQNTIFFIKKNINCVEMIAVETARKNTRKEKHLLFHLWCKNSLVTLTGHTIRCPRGRYTTLYQLPCNRRNNQAEKLK